MIIHTRDGKSIEFELEKQPETTFVNGNLTINAQGFIAEYPLESILKYTFSSDDAGVDDPEADRIKISRIDSFIYIDGIAPTDPVDIYSMDGKKITSYTGSLSSTLRIDLSSLPKGAYILKVGKTALKILN